MLLMTGDVPGRLLAILDPKHPYFEIDDAFFTGILAETAGIMRVHLKHGIYWHEELIGDHLGKGWRNRFRLRGQAYLPVLLTLGFRFMFWLVFVFDLGLDLFVEVVMRMITSRILHSTPEKITNKV